jgi:hypothetical protein
MLFRIGQFVAATAALALVAAGLAVAQPRPLPGDVGPVADGGAFVIQSCGETGSASGWAEIVNNDLLALASGIDCPPSELAPDGQAPDYQHAGLWVGDRLGVDQGYEAVPGDRVELAFTPIAGTVIRRIRLWRSVFKQLDNHWQPYISIGDPNTTPESCDFVVGHQTCGVGGTDWYPYDNNFENDVLAYRDVPNLSASTVAAGVYCRANTDNLCANGYSLPRAEVQILSAFLTIGDNGMPAIDGVIGDGWSGRGWRQGTLPLVAASRDVTGIAATKVYADGSLVATLQRTCRYDRPRPCSDEGGAAVGIPTEGLADGPHRIDVGVVDAAGNETRVRRSESLLIDNAAPAAPVGIGSPQATSGTNSFSIAWSLPADSGTPITAARYQVCQSGSCGDTRTAPSTTSIDGLALPATGAATVRVWLEDQLGHADPLGAATVALTYAPPPVPRDESQQPPAQQPLTPTLPGCALSCGTGAPAPTPTTSTKKASPALKLKTLRRVGRRVTVAGSVDARASGHVTVRYRVRIHGRTRMLTKRVKISRRAFRTTLKLSTALASVRTATVSIAYPGDANTVPQTRTATLRTRA